jgi:hypothetical protein
MAKKPKTTTPGKGRTLTDLTPGVHAEVVRLLRAGNCRDTAAASVGIFTDKFRSWLREGYRGVEPFAQFALDVRQAEAYAEEQLIAGIQQAGYRGVLKTVTETALGDGTVERTVERRQERGDAKALMWLAERRGARNWSLGWQERKLAAKAARVASKAETAEPLQVIVREADPDASYPDPLHGPTDVGLPSPT